MKKNLFLILALALSAHLFLLVNLRFTPWPEMLFWPYLILKGWLPYKDIAIVHTPALLFDLTIFYKIFGVGLIQLKAYTWILILITDALVFWVAKKLWGYKEAILALLFYIPFQLFYEGNGLWFDLALAPLALLIYFCLKQKKYLWVGICWGLAFLTKQTAFWFLVPIGLALVRDFRPKRIKSIALGTLIIFGVASAVFLALGIWRDFIRWAFEFGVWQLPRAQGQIHLPGLRQLLLSLLPFAILSPLIFEKGRKNLNLVAWAFFGLLGVYPRFELFHFQPALPFLAMGAGIVLARFTGKKSVLVLLGLGYLVLVYVLVGKLWMKGTRFFEPEVLEVASYIKKNTDPGEEIYVINAWDSLYALSDTVPAIRPWIPHLSWYMELPGVQDEIVSDLTKNHPKLIVQGEYEETGLGAYKPAKVTEFISQNYKVKGKIGRYLILTPNYENFVFKYLPE
uniref:Glycosyltransferase RgtA/B/C/D-like domain-containing protein n=1 Tax=candidate division WWE3 bacterium TaxID=2053526 RepID=A0A7C4TJA2_UNCKA